nr:MAG TPA: hypothetical protein [Caudoviricetes sp.]
MDKQEQTSILKNARQATSTAGRPSCYSKS